MTLQEEYSATIQEIIPTRFRSVRLSELKPSEKSRLPLEDQKALYGELRAKPLSGWAFFAPAGYSKTTCSWALYKCALVDNMKFSRKTGRGEFTCHHGDRIVPH